MRPGRILPVLTLASLSAYLPVVSSTVTCKCLPGDACFPTATEWAALSANLTHPLISGQLPLASVCYSNSTNYSPSACASATALENNPTYLAGLSNAAQYVNFEAIINTTANTTTILDCPYNVTSGTGCSQGRVPPYAVNVSTVSDVQYAVQFASRYNLHLVVRNSGHELMGRSLGVGSLEIFTHNLQSTDFYDNFVPDGAPPNTTGQYAVTMGAGVSWAQMYSLADQHNRSLPGGLSPQGTVGAAGGWVLGGGHSALSRYFGLGVDNALQFTVVLPNASFVTANEYQNSDLFWALRGGGGPSFGVVLSTTTKTYPNSPYTVLFYTATGNSTAAYTQLLETWNDHHNTVNDAGWCGVWPFFDNTLWLTFFAQGTPPIETNINSTMEAFISASKAIPGVNVSLALTVPYRSFEAFNLDNLVDSSKGYGFNFTTVAPGPPHSVTSSWLLPRNLTTPENSKTLGGIYANLTGGVAYMVGGGPVASADPDSVASTPAWRTTVSDLVLLPTGPGEAAITTATIPELWQSSYDQMQPFRQLAPPPVGGQYLNEPDYLETDWQNAYWGAHYPRLLSIKKEIDPQDLLIVRKGVNSEDWNDEITCKTVAT